MSGNDIVKLPSAKDAEAVETIPLFELDGETYSIPKNPRAGISLSYLELATTQSQEAAAYYMLHEMLGEEGYNALKNHPTLTQEQFNEVFSRVEERVLASNEEDNTSGNDRASGNRAKR